MSSTTLRKQGCSDRARGYAYGIAAVIGVSPDSLLLRLPSQKEDVLLVTAYRCTWVCALSTISVIMQAGGVVKLLIRARASLRSLLLVALFASITSIGFPLALQLTGAAEALLLISLSPLWGALIGWFCLGDELPRKTILALAGAMLSIGLIFVPRMLSQADAVEDRPFHHIGDLVAFCTGWGLAGFGNAVRYCRRRHNDMPTQLAQVASSGLAVAFCVGTLTATGRPVSAHEPERLWWITCLMGILLSVAYLGFNAAPKYIPAAEFGIICLLEAVLGPAWVYLGTGEAPAGWTLLGGALLISTLAAHEIMPQASTNDGSSSTVTISASLDPNDDLEEYQYQCHDEPCD